MVTYADRALSVLGYHRNGEFHSAVHDILRVANTTPASSTAEAECNAHAVRQIIEVLSAASARYRRFIGASSSLPLPAFTDESDKAAAMQTHAKAARHLVTSIGIVMPSLLHSGPGARAGDGAAAVDDDDDDDDDDGDGDDDDVGGGGGDSKAAKRKRRRLAAAQAAGGSGGYSRRGRATSHTTPGDFTDRVQSVGDIVTFTWPSRDDKPECVRSFDAGGVKADLAEFGVENTDEICVLFQFMYAMSTNFGDDDNRLLPVPAARWPRLRRGRGARAGGRARSAPHQLVGVLMEARSAPAAIAALVLPSRPLGSVVAIKRAGFLSRRRVALALLSR